MKTLLLMRHAKSSWDNPGLRDFDRPLNERGLKAAPLMGRYLRAQGIAPDLIVSSPAQRAQQTVNWSRVLFFCIPELFRTLYCLL